MSYVVIEFSDGGGVAVVRNIWLTPRKKEVFWPPIKNQRTFENFRKNNMQIQKNGNCIQYKDVYLKLVSIKRKILII